MSRPLLELNDIPGMRVTVMGLGLHGGGIATARFFASLGARVLVTDLRSQAQLQSSLDALDGLDISFRLGEHAEEDFTSADLVIKNPAVPPSSPYLKLAQRVSNDIAVFLSLSRRPLFALTGTKGKSTTASAVHHVLRRIDPDAALGGNITVSPLTFLLDSIRNAEITESDAPVVLELSSWQLADCQPQALIKPQISMITNIMHDHQNRYAHFEEYVEDKRRIFTAQGSSELAVFNQDDPYGRRFAAECRAGVRMFSSGRLPAGIDGGYLHGAGGFIRVNGHERECLPPQLKLPGIHNRLNMLAAAVMLEAAGVPGDEIIAGLEDFPGIPHRLEAVGTVDGVRYYNDSAATMPQATTAAVASFTEPVHLIAGGTDKELDFSGLGKAISNVAGLYLLSGNATPRFQEAARQAGRSWYGPYNSLADAVNAVRDRANSGEIVLLSPGCASFGMFANEFDRGNQFRDLVAGMSRPV